MLPKSFRGRPTGGAQDEEESDEEVRERKKESGEREKERERIENSFDFY